MELKSIFIYPIFLSSIKYLLFHSMITFIPNTRIILELAQLAFSTLVLIVNFHLVSSVSFIDALSMKRISTPDLLFQCHVPLDSELMEALLVFILSDFLDRLFQLINILSQRNIEIVRSLLFAYFIIEGFFINQIGTVLLLGIFQNLVSILKCIFNQFSHSQKRILIRINLIFLISFWLYSFLLVIPYHSFYQILSLQCNEVADYRLKLFIFVFFSYYIVQLCLNPIREYRKLLEKELVIISKVLKLDSPFVNEDSKSNMPGLDGSNTGAKIHHKGSSKNAKNQVMMMQMIRCVISLKKKARRIKERNKSECKENYIKSTTEIQN